MLPEYPWDEGPLARALGIPAEDMVRYLSRSAARVQCERWIGLVSWRMSPNGSQQASHHDLLSGDGGPYITSGVVVSRFEDKINACVHRLMVLGKDRWQQGWSGKAYPSAL